MPLVSPTYNLVVRVGLKGVPFYEVKWRRDGEQIKRRLGRAWLEADGPGGWKRRGGRVRPGFLDDRLAHARAVELVAAVERELADAERHARERAQRPVTVRDLAHEWLEWLRDVKRAKPATLRDYEALLREPGTRFKRGSGVSAGRIMAALGDKPIAAVRTRDVSRFLRELDAEGLTPRNVNKHRQTLSAMFQCACREDAHDLPANPVTGSEKRLEAPPPALDYYEPHEIEALADAAAAGTHRRAPDDATRRMDAQDAEMFRLLFFTGLRVGEATAMRWDAVDLAARMLLVRRAVSAGEEGIPNGRRFRVVPLTLGAVEALQRVRERREFLSPDDYVFCNLWGRRLDVSAVRRRFKAAAAAAGLRPVKLQGFRHAAGSIAARTADPVFVRDMLGHAKLNTTDRYVSAKYRPEEFARLDAAFGGVTMEAVKDRSGIKRPARWTAEEIERERRAEQARVRRDAARTPEENLEEVRALTAFATELAEAGKRAPMAAADHGGERPPLDPLPLLWALHDAGVAYVLIGGFAVNVYGVIRPSKDLDIVPAGDTENAERLAALLRRLSARHVGLGDFDADEFPFDPTDPGDLAQGANFRLETDLGDLDIMQWVPGIDAEHAYVDLAARARRVEVSGVELLVCSLDDLRAMKEAAGRPRDLDDLQRLAGLDVAG